MAAVLSAVTSATALAAVVVRPDFWLAYGSALSCLISIGLLTAVVGTGVVARSERRLRRRVDRLESMVESNRVKESRHEYHQERSLDRIEQTAREVAVTTAGLAWMAPPDMAPDEEAGAPARILFVTSNGGGMGHLARCSAVMRHSSELLTGRILTLSTAAYTVRDAGFDVRYFPSSSESQCSAERWRQKFTHRLMTEVAEYRPTALVFDGTWVYPSLTDVAQYTDVPLVWLRRGLWRADADMTQVGSWRRWVTSVITPDDVAETKESAPEVFRDARWTAPVSLAPSTIPPRDSALATLGLDPARRYALVQLAGGNGGGSATLSAVDAIRATSDIVPVVVRSPLLPDLGEYHAEIISGRFPLVDVASAWEFTITGAGYNSVHENLHTSTPGVYLPSRSTITDDQVRRAAAVSECGIGVDARDTGDLASRIRQLVAHDGAVVEAMRGKLRELQVSNGASSVGAAVATTALGGVR